MKMKELLVKKDCRYKYYLDCLNLNGTKGLNYYIKISLNKVLASKKRDFMYCEDEIYKNLIKNIEEGFEKFEYEDTLKELSKQIKRYYDFEIQNFDIVDFNIGDFIEIEGHKIFVMADIVLKSKFNNKKYIMSFSSSSPKLSYKARKEENMPNNSLTLYLLNKLGQKLYKEDNIISGIFYLKAKGDVKNKLCEEFESKKGQNMIIVNSEDLNQLNLDKEILQIINSEDISKCESSKCQFCNYNNLCTYKKSNDINLEKIECNKNVSIKSNQFSPSLNQLKFIKFTEGKVRVNAVAGSGKTTVIAKRVLNLIDEGESPKEMLLITFSEKGCEELYNKLKFWSKVDNKNINIKDIDIKTFNGFCYDLIKENYKACGFTERPALIDNIMKYKIIFNIIKDEPKISNMYYKNPYFNMFRTKGVCVELLDIFDKIKRDEMLFPEEVSLVFNFDIEKSKRIIKYYQEFNKRLKEQNLLDYQDQINLGVNLILNKKNKDYRHIIVDEFQDSDSKQLFIIRKLIENKRFKSLAVLGDENQSIYSFRNTSPKNILEFNKKFSDVKDINLKNNFRSTKEISNLANKITQINSSNKKIVSIKNGNMPIILNGKDSDVVNEVQKLINKNIHLNDIAIITRTRKELIEISKILNDEKIPHLMRVSELLIENCNVKNIIGYSNFLKDNSLLLHFVEYLQVVDLEGLRSAKDKHNYINQKYKDFINKYDLDNLNDKQKLNVFFETLENVTKNDKAVNKLITLLKSYDFNSIFDLSNYLNDMKKFKSDVSIDKEEEEFNAIDLITAHSAKGREYKYVLALIDKFDIKNFKEGQNNEELRLLYVTITRAKENLIIFSDNIFNEELNTLNHILIS